MEGERGCMESGGRRWEEERVNRGWHSGGKVCIPLGRLFPNKEVLLIISRCATDH